MNDNTKANFDSWCLVELFGHAKIAGRCMEQNFAGNTWLRVDVPETDTKPGFTRFFGASAIYAINPIDEKTARFIANTLSLAPIEIWNIEKLMDKVKQLPAGELENDEESELRDITDDHLSNW